MMKRFFNKYSITPMMRYLLFSILVTVIDTVVVWFMYHILGIHVVVSNTIGVVIGFVIHYLLSTKAVFDTELGIKGFAVYLGTFILGLVFADWIIYVSESILFIALTKGLRFLFSKGLSIVLPFFFLYFLRRRLFEMLQHYKKADSSLS